MSQKLSPADRVTAIGESFKVIRAEVEASAPASRYRDAAIKKLDAAEESALRAVLAAKAKGE